MCLEEDRSIITLGKELSFIHTIRKIKKTRKNCKRGEVRSDSKKAKNPNSMKPAEQRNHEAEKGKVTNASQR